MTGRSGVSDAPLRRRGGAFPCRFVRAEHAREDCARADDARAESERTALERRAAPLLSGVLPGACRADRDVNMHPAKHDAQRHAGASGQCGRRSLAKINPVDNSVPGRERDAARTVGAPLDDQLTIDRQSVGAGMTAIGAG